MRVLDLRVLLPHLGPQPRPAQEGRGDVPQGIALFDDVARRVAGLQIGDLGRGAVHEHRGQQDSKEFSQHSYIRSPRLKLSRDRRKYTGGDRRPAAGRICYYSSAIMAVVLDPPPV